eukprot:CAMPEP_0206230284 /NCGR_PEP_ID=MMETSP0047_2-20121206/10171_1 /ASSEMBLY_ACC=CAM_ASM_000192 /TAXON_ID=195065 /ORGANISM="Chroomonas mesostigmatica_cf, Strain CCMP1168" /LENGTH=493 /DNA_ID=CAMNT_0053653685 /DNA_START=230 /DNA_END=1711 /DNA_ORIENTATION=+
MQESDEARSEQAAIVERLLASARKAAEVAEEAEKRVVELKASPLNALAETARKNRLEQERQRLDKEARSRAEEAIKLAADADKAEKERGTSTLAQKLSDKSTALNDAAMEAERKAEALGRAISGELEPADVSAEAAGSREPVSYQECVSALKSVTLIPSAGSRTEISRTTGALDDLKRLGKLSLWASVDAATGSNTYRGASSLQQLLRITKIEEGQADKKLGVTSYRALQLKNQVMGSIMLAGGLGLLLEGATEGSAVSTGGAQFLIAFGYSALLLNVLMGFFAQQTNEWICKKLYDVNFDDYQERALLCEAGHLLMSWICGLPLQDFERQHVGYPLKDRPTGRAQIFSSRRGDPEILPRGRPFGLPPWASLEKEVSTDTMFDAIDPEPIKNGYSQREIDHLSLVLMAGPVAEFIVKGSATNGASVFQQLDTCMLMSQSAIPADKMQVQARWAIIKTETILKANEKKLMALVDALRREDSLVQCIAVMESVHE